LVKHIRRTGARYGVPAVGCAVRAAVEHTGKFCAAQACADRKAAAQSLRRRYNIRLNSIIFITEQLTGTSHTGLYLVNDQKQVAFFTKIIQLQYKFLFQRADAAFSLD